LERPANFHKHVCRYQPDVRADNFKVGRDLKPKKVFRNAVRPDSFL
jgi:hypothetical protein